MPNCGRQQSCEVASLASHELLALYYIDALGRRDRRAVEKHLPHCARCRTGLSELAETGALIERESGAIEGGAIEPPRALLQRILTSAQNQPQASSGLRRPLP
jgi:anti-sigma factor RsiW